MAMYGSIEDWDTSQVTDMSNWFNIGAVSGGLGCCCFCPSGTKYAGLTTSNSSSGNTGDVDLSSWDVSHVTSMESMFQNAVYGADAFSVTQDGWTNLTLTGWDTGSVTNMDSMFEVGSFTTLGADAQVQGLSDLDYSSVTTMARMFYGVATGIQLCWDLSDAAAWASMTTGGAKDIFGGEYYDNQCCYPTPPDPWNNSKAFRSCVCILDSCSGTPAANIPIPMKDGVCSNVINPTPPIWPYTCTATSGGNCENWTESCAAAAAACPCTDPDTMSPEECAACILDACT